VWDLINPSIISGGWDNKVLMLDVRTSKAVRNFGEPAISRDSLDATRNYLITRSFRQKEIIDIWDLGSGKIIESC
jgi:hypothetical protein